MATLPTTIFDIPPIAALSEMLFAQGDEVVTKGDRHPFWMTVTSVNSRTGFCRCKFGGSGIDAGNFHQRELKFYGGALIQMAG